MSKKSKSKMIMNEIKNMYVGLIKMYGNFLILKNFKKYFGDTSTTYLKVQYFLVT